MAKETQKAKIERLEQEVQELKDEKSKYLNDITDLHSQLNAKTSEITESEPYQSLLKDRDMYFKTIQLEQKSKETWKQRFRETIDRLQNENEQLQNNIQQLKNENEQLQRKSNIQELKNEQIEKPVEIKKLKNERNAGRKSKFTDQQIGEIIQDRKSMTIIQLAEKYNCSTGLIHKLTYEKKFRY